MSQVARGLLYTDDHEWIRAEGGVGTVGISDYAQGALGDVTYVELPELGKEVKQGEEACAVESCKAASSIFAPASGRVVEVNSALEDDPGLVNSDCYGAGWIFKLELADEAELTRLKTAEDYEQMLAGLE